MHQIEDVVRDKGSKYAVSGGNANCNEQAKAFVRLLRAKKKYAKATHNTWAVIFYDESKGKTLVKNDDGESGAGMVMLRMLERQAMYNHIVVVTRWYGGTHLGGDRFRHVQTCVNAYLDDMKLQGR